MDEQLFARVVAVISRCFVEEGRLQDTVNYLEEVIVHTIEKEQIFVVINLRKSKQMNFSGRRLVLFVARHIFEWEM